MAEDSSVETYAALRVDIDNWRWADVPFFLRTGKALAKKDSEITLKFRRVPFNVFSDTEVDFVPRDHITFRVQPHEGITLWLNAKTPGPGLNLSRVKMDFDYERGFASPIADSYKLLLMEALRGDHSLFLRQDGVERAWEVLQPVLDAPNPVIAYDKGSWGPDEADALIAPRRWHVSTE